MLLVTFCEGKGTAPVSLVGKIPETSVGTSLETVSWAISLKINSKNIDWDLDCTFEVRQIALYLLKSKTAFPVLTKL